MNEMRTDEVKELLEVLHDRLSYVLSDPSGDIYHGDEFNRVFDQAITSLEWR